jgi:phosphoglycerate kinase
MNATDIPLPLDVVTAKEFSVDAKSKIKLISEIESDDYILDIGPQTAGKFSQLIGTMETIIWNGPVGVFEFPQFSRGTSAIAVAVAENDGFSLAGGGETIAAIEKFGVTDQISYISTGGGAFLEYIQGIELPAVKILKERVFSNLA